MFRRALTILVVLSMAAFGYQPSLALMVPAGQTVAGEVMSTAKLAAMPDCVSATAEHDCCDQTGKQKQNCAWDGACAARCLVAIVIAPAMYAPFVVFNPAAPVTMGTPQLQRPERPGPLFRPPIV